MTVLYVTFQCATLRYGTDTPKIITGEKKMWNETCFMVSVSESVKYQ